MKDFIHTGWWAPTWTTTEDPLLQVVERDNGISWSIAFYVGDHMIDYINMEMFGGSKLNIDVLRLPVYSDEGILLGSVENRLKYAYHIMH